MCVLLDRRALNRTERAEHAAVARIRAQAGLAVAALVVELTSVRGHGFLLGEAAVRTGHHGFKNDSAHCGVTSARWMDTPRLSSPWSAPRAGFCRGRRSQWPSSCRNRS